MKRKNAKHGDLFEVNTRKGLAFIQFAAKHYELGDVIKVYPNLFKRRPDNIEAVLKKNGYLAFYPVCAAYNQGLIVFVKNLPLLENVNIYKTRRPGARSNDGKILTWIISNNEHEELHKTLPDEALNLPIGVIWNHEMLVTRIVEQWYPSYCK